MKSPRREDAGRGGAADGSIPHPTAHNEYLLETPCPCCLEPHTKPPRGLACYVADAQVVWYYLCERCGQTIEKAGRARRQRLTTRIEHNLEELGALEGLRRTRP